jgi:four helix bundle protein
MLSVPNNIAEGSGSRSNKNFQHFLNIAHRSVFETASMLLVLERRSILKKEEAEEALERLDHLARRIVRFSSTL